MSMKSTIVYGTGYHLYEDVADTDTVSLEVTNECAGFDFAAGPEECRVSMSRETWDAILAGIATDA